MGYAVSWLSSDKSAEISSSMQVLIYGKKRVTEADMIVKSHLHVRGVIIWYPERRDEHTHMPQRQKKAVGRRISPQLSLILEEKLSVRVMNQGPDSLVTKRKVNVPSRAINLAMGIAFIESHIYFERVRPSTKHWTKSPEILQQVS